MSGKIIANVVTSTRLPNAPMVSTHFSLFEDDPLNRLLKYVHIGNEGVLNLCARAVLLWLVTAFPTAAFALYGGFDFHQPRLLNFFGDIGAFGQAFLGYPLFIYAESRIGKSTYAAAKHFRLSGVIDAKYFSELDRIEAKVAKLRKQKWIELALLAAGFLLAMGWLYDETHNSYDTWHALGAPGVQTPTLAGWWVALVGIPIFNFWWLRWMWKISLWCWYLSQVSKFRLRLIASHPDLTGGIGFISSTQKSFAIVIFAFGVGVIAPVVGYKLELEHTSIFSYATGGPLFSFIIGAPLFFMLPLLMFTKQLAETKSRAVAAYQDRATEAALYFEKKWLNATHGEKGDELFGNYLQGMKNLNLAFEHIGKMRVVPFDLHSFTQLIGSTMGSLLPFIPKLFDLPAPALKVLEMIKPLLGK